MIYTINNALNVNMFAKQKKIKCVTAKFKIKIKINKIGYLSLN